MSKQVLIDFDFNNTGTVTGLRAPSADSDAVRLVDLNSAIEGLAWKDSARVASVANVTLSSPGATIDGITLSNNDRVLLKNQTTGSENGIYIFNGSSTPMTRSLDASTADELEQAVVTVEEGTSAGATYRQTQVNFTLGSGTVTWTTFGTSAAAASETVAGIAEIATQTETDTGTDDARIVTPLKLATWSGRKLKYSAAVGDGSATSYTITHNLGTRDLTVAVYRNSGNYDEVIVDVQHTTTNSVTLIFGSAPAASAFRVVVTG